MDIKALGEAIVKTVKEFVGRQIDAITARVDALTERLDNLPTPKDGQPGKDGKNVDMDVVNAEIAKRIDAFVDSVNARIAEKDLAINQAIEKCLAIEPPQFTPPKDGDPGRDALDLDVRLSIDEERRYPRGSYATHKGGLWKTIRTSEGMDGWECIVDGVDAVEIEMTGDREITVKTRMSSGREVSKAFEMPVVIDRGVFKDGTAYKAGDGVTWAGSFWIAQKATSEKPDMQDSGFRLAVKRGRDGRDVVPVPPKDAPLKIDGKGAVQ